MWYKIENNVIKINIIAKPNAKKSALIKVTDQGMHIAIHAKPSDGEANNALIIFLSKLFNLPKTQIKMVRGQTSRYKQVLLPIGDKQLQQLALLSEQT